MKGVGEGPIENIIAAREKGGHFKDLFDFCARIDTKKVNKRVLEKLIKSGAMDRLGPNRAAMMQRWMMLSVPRANTIRPKPLVRRICSGY